MNNIFDTHCHPYLNKIKKQEEVINSFFSNGGKYMMIIGTNPETNNSAIDISRKYNNIFCSIGIHPCDVYNLNLDKTIKDLEKLLSNNNKIKAIGECGLDYYWLKPENNQEISKYKEEKQEKIINEKKDIQKRFFKAQLILANKYKLPVIIHNRESKNDILEVLKELNFKNFIFHCYSEDLDYAKKLIEFSANCKISFSGIITFKNAKDIQETAKYIDIKYILAETDSPYLTPTPFRGKEENEPIYTKYIVEKIEEIRGEKCAEKIFQNSINTFGI